MSDAQRATTGLAPRVRWFVIVYAVAFCVRAVELFELSETPLLEFVLGDAKNYVAWGREIASGSWIGDETFYQAPLYPYFLGIAFALFGDDLFNVRVIQVFVGSTSCALLALAGWRLFGKSAGIVAGLGLALYGPSLYADVMLQKSVLDIFFMCLGLWFLSAVSTLASLRAAFGLGIAVGFMTLTRENAMVFPLVLVPWMALGLEQPQPKRLALAGVFLTAMSLVLMPVVLRNYAVGGEFHLTTSQFGHNFYIGNNPAADGTYKPLIEGRGDPRIERLDAIDLAQRAVGRELAPSEVSGFYTQRALDYIQSQPLDWLALMFRKVMLVFTSIEVVDTEDQYTHAESSTVLDLLGSLFHFGVLVPMAVLGLVLTWPRRRALLPLYGLFTIYAATLVVFYFFARYRLPLVPIAMLFAGAAIAGARAFVSERPHPIFVRTLAAMLLVAIFCNWPLMDERYMRSVTHYNLGNELAAVGR
ncbi:MAG: glycosyltransferase family 39 protein, partial [bacterium]|nr:glycosyltransferase family 39 protein [bacterium]